MSEAHERIFVAWPQPNATGLAFTSVASNRTEYARADLLTAALARAEAAEAAHATAREEVTGVIASLIAWHKEPSASEAYKIGRKAWPSAEALLVALIKEPPHGA